MSFGFLAGGLLAFLAAVYVAERWSVVAVGIILLATAALL